jgi:hypothetical protein
VALVEADKRRLDIVCLLPWFSHYADLCRPRSGKCSPGRGAPCYCAMSASGQSIWLGGRLLWGRKRPLGAQALTLGRLALLPIGRARGSRHTRQAFPGSIRAGARGVRRDRRASSSRAVSQGAGTWAFATSRPENTCRAAIQKMAFEVIASPRANCAPREARSSESATALQRFSQHRPP